MLKPQPFANALAITSLIFYIGLYILKILAPPFFQLLLNSQFLGADIASQVPDLNVANLAGILIAITVVSWTAGYIVAVIYNRFAEKK